ncbi:MAG: thiamine pyrophosphate-dependent enzyme [Egibacteraceae bacterium]
MRDPVAASEEALDACLLELAPAAHRLHETDALPGSASLTAERAVALFTDQVRSRALDVAARHLKASGAGHYTIASAGHEQNGVLGALLRPTDPSFLHYRSGAFMMARSRQLPERDPVWDTLLSLVAAAEDPASGGRHKVWGSHPLWVPPQTSTIASHVPKAVGAAFALERARRLNLELPVPSDAIVCCSFGDASANHATALAGINAARYAQRRGQPTPLLLVCEDNGLGISVATPPGWIAERFASLPRLRYIRASGELDAIWAAVEQAIASCRSGRRPVFLHLETVRLWGHAGSDVERIYRPAELIAADAARDPLLANAHRLVETGAATPAHLSEIVRSVRARVAELSPQAAARPKLASAAEVTAPLAPLDLDACRADATVVASEVLRRGVHGGGLPEHATAPPRRTMAGLVNAALRDELARRPELLVFGEDVGRKGGVYHLTAGLQETFGPQRVFDTLLDETTILGIAQGAGLLGMLAMPEIQYLAYVHNALDQIRGEAASLSFFSNGRFRNPMVVRIAGLAYQKGFGGHFHNDHSVGALRDIPGLIIAVPSIGEDAVRMLRGALAMARVDGRVVVFLEPIALYHEKDRYTEGDGGWLSDYPPPGSALLPGEVGVHRPEARDVLVVSYANGLRMALRAARRLSEQQGIEARVLDLRWLAPLPWTEIEEHAQECGGVLVADECRATGGGIADAVIARLAETGYDRPLASVRSADSFVPLGPAAETVLLSETEIVDAAVALTER